MPPISTGSARPFAVTIRLAPRLRNSRFTRSPISSITPSMAVATADPMATAATVITVRRGDRRSDWLTNLRNMLRRRVAEDLLARHQLVRRNHQLIAFHFRLDGNRIAPAVLAYARNEDCRCAVLADHVASLLIIALGPTDLAGIERRYQRLVRLANHDHAHVHAIGFNREAMQVAIVHAGHRNAQPAVHHAHRRGLGQLTGRFRVD